MKKNRKLDKIISKAVDASIKGTSIDESKVAQFSKTFKTLSLSDAVYALTQYKKGLAEFINQHTVTISAPIELPTETLNKIKQSINSKLEIRNLKFNLDSSLLAGFKFKIGDEVYDNSLRSTLESLKTK